MKFLKPIVAAGVATIILYAGLALCVLLLSFNFLFPEIVKSIGGVTWDIEGRLNTAVKLLGLILLANILYLRIKETPRSSVANELADAGISGVLERAGGTAFERLMAEPGEKHILNTYIHNIGDIESLLSKALEHSSTTIHFTLLRPNSPHALNRGEELPDANIMETINTNIRTIARFYSSLDSDKRKRVHVHLFSSALKFAIHGSGQRAFVGMYLPAKNSINNTQFVIDGRSGHFSSRIWNYYESLEKQEITSTLLSKNSWSE